MKNFWENLEKPIYALAPMAGFTDLAFRQICQEFGADVVYSEMASATALVYNPEKTLEMLKFIKPSGPYVVQLFGSRPEHFSKGAELVAKKIKPDGIDINFGCPVKKVAKQGAGAVLMNNLKLAREILKSVIGSTGLPVSIKTRAGAGGVNILKFLDKINDLDIKAVMIHGRTLARGFSGPVDAGIIKKARDYFSRIILANGGVMSVDDAQELIEKTGADGVGIARGALGRPWIFSEVKAGGNKSTMPGIHAPEIFKIALKHARLVDKLKGRSGIIEMRKHLCWYAQGLLGARKIRERLVKVESVRDVEEIMESEK